MRYVFILFLFISCTHPRLYKLEVEGGSGNGNYEAETRVTIQAEVLAGSRFLSWEGDTSFLHNPKDGKTFLIMPEQNVYLKTYSLPANEVSFRYEVYPVIRTHCLFEGCHVNSTRQENLVHYDEIVRVTSKMQFYLESGFMPLNRTISAADKNLLLKWIEQGAPFN